MKTQKIFPVFIALIAISLVVYVAVYKLDLGKGSGTIASSGGQDREILTYVPADTIFFFGGVQPASMKEASEMIATQQGWLNSIDWSETLKDEQLAQAAPAEKMMAGLYVEYLKALKDLESAAKHFGVGDNVDSVFYTIGAIPVLRVKLEDPVAFNTFLDNAETAAKTTSQKESLGDINYRSYSFDRADTQNPSNMKLVIAEHGGYAVISAATPLEDETARKKIMGAEKPASSLAKQTNLVELRDKYQYHPAYIGYINHRAVMDGLTAGDGNDFGRMLDVFLKSMSENMQENTAQDPVQAPDNMAESAQAGEDPLAKIRTPECRTELMAVADNWPQTVFGYTKIDTQSKPNVFVAKGTIESHDAAFLQEIIKLRGYIPSTVSKLDSKPLFGFGLGINVDALLPFATAFIQGITQKDYQCPMLAEMKQSLGEANPAMALGMMSGMVAGLQGVSAAILDMEGSLDMNPEQPMPDIKSIDAIITVSSSNPQSIVMMASGMMQGQGMPPIQLPADGTAVDFPLPIPLPINESPKLAIKGNHLVAYIGPKGEQAANKLANEPITQNGLMSFAMDFGRYTKFIASSVEGIQKTSGDQPDITPTELATFKALSNMKSQLIENLDVSSNGIEFGMEMTLE